MNLAAFSSMGGFKTFADVSFATVQDLINFLIKNGMYGGDMAINFKTNDGTSGTFTNVEQEIGDIEALTVTCVPAKYSNGWEYPFEDNEETIEDRLDEIGDFSGFDTWSYNSLKTFAKRFRTHCVEEELESVAEAIGHRYMAIPKNELIDNLTNAIGIYKALMYPVEETTNDEVINELKVRIFALEFKLGVTNKYNVGDYEKVARSL